MNDPLLKKIKTEIKKGKNLFNFLKKQGISNKQIEEIIKYQIIEKEMKTIDIVKMVKLLLNEESENLTGQVLHVGGY